MPVAKTWPLNSLIFVMDRHAGRGPHPIRGELIQSWPAGLSIGCFPEQDGETEVVLGPTEEVDPGDVPSLKTDIETPSRWIAVMTVGFQTLLDAKVPDERTRVRIWANHSRWPSRVIVGFETALKLFN